MFFNKAYTVDTHAKVRGTMLKSASCSSRGSVFAGKTDRKRMKGLLGLSVGFSELIEVGEHGHTTKTTRCTA